MKITTFDIFFQTVIILDIYLIHSMTVSIPKRVGLLGNNNVSLECVYTKSDCETFVKLAWSRHRIGDLSADILANVDENYNVALTNKADYLKKRTVVKFVPGVFTITYMYVRCEDQAAYLCSVSCNGDSTAPSAKMDFQVLTRPKPESSSPPSPSSPNLYIIAGIVLVGIVVFVLIVAVTMCIRSKSRSSLRTESTISKVEAHKVKGHKVKGHKAKGHKAKGH
ncbi:uncharacterized protein LOC121373389 [Gigantopelta aegis]|uniref:uncharacterized protein LOC121373389 n=1 Tax=Gigantopelta aegis TaxID=1735272 RepID=UPI001B88B439|nr:uncharacterized protein LOC121373389 [Gigantopelta aegis]XP_041355959.1 uncharacterized protein LOC121373389 [Gigantopelta aegis]